MLKKKTTTLLITVALLTSVMPAAFADTTEQPPQMPTQSQGKQPPANLTELNPTVSNHRKCLTANNRKVI